DVHPARNDQVAGPVGEVEVAVAVEVPDVADGPPATLVGCGGRLVQVAVVLRRRAALEPDRARLARRQLRSIKTDHMRYAHQRPADGARLAQPFVGEDGCGAE